MSLARKRKAQGGDGNPSSEKHGKQHRKCDRRGCELFHSHPFCFVQVSERCARDGYTSRWYHISAGQHFCNECFEYFYRSSKPGNSVYTHWTQVWEREAGDRIPPGPKVFLTDQYLPVWVRCTRKECQKWRKLPPSIELHHVKQDIVHCSNCEIPQDEVVSIVEQPQWITSVSYIPLLRFSILAPLLSEYVPDGVGISPATVRHVTQPQQPAALTTVATATNSDGETKPQTSNSSEGLSPMIDPLHPFNHPQEGPRARAFTPDIMEAEEIAFFPEYNKVCDSQSKWQSPKLEAYCILRNLILALWLHNYKSYLTAAKCMQALSLRGILRIWCSFHLPNILQFLTERAYVNCGFLSDVPRPLPLAVDRRSHVIVIGAGPAGLASAYHLRTFGYKVIVLEASNRIGGRVMDDFSLGACIGMGAMFITGICNNPFTLLSRQLGLDIQLINEDRCELISEQGRPPEAAVDSEVEAHFNSALDKLAAWRSGPVTDVSLQQKLNELHKQCLSDGGGVEYSEEKTRLLDFHYSNLEFACGATLDKVSSLHWDHNDNFPQFSGCHTLLPSGYTSILSRLAEGVEVHLGTGVKVVEVCGGEGQRGVVRLEDFNGHSWKADKVVVTIPLAILKEDLMTFSPPLPVRKQQAIRKLGAGLVEKVALKFSTPFWRKAVGNADFFGHIATSLELRGMFGVFYDLSSRKPRHKVQNSGSSLGGVGGGGGGGGPSADHKGAPNFILVTTVSGKALDAYNKLNEADIVELCLKTLRCMFPNCEVPVPSGYIVSRWGVNPFARMSYSYAAVGSSGVEYDTLAEDVGGKIFFAGEATNRQHPQTVTGAYLSGVREACKIMDADKLARRGAGGGGLATSSRQSTS